MSLYPENPRGQILQVVSQDTYASFDAPLSVIGSGGSGPTPIDASITTSTIKFNTGTSAGSSAIINMKQAIQY